MEVKFKNFCNRHIMWELPTIKTDFLFENSQDFNQTTHARPQHSIVFIDNISLYFNCIISVKYVFKWSRHGHIMPFSAVRTKHQPQKGREKCLCIVWNTSFFALFSKWQHPDIKLIPNDQNRKYFICSTMFHFF